MAPASRVAGPLASWTASNPSRPDGPGDLGHSLQPLTDGHVTRVGRRSGTGREGIRGFCFGETIELPSVGQDFFFRPWVQPLCFFMILMIVSVAICVLPTRCINGPGDTLVLTSRLRQSTTSLSGKLF